MVTRLARSWLPRRQDWQHSALHARTDQPLRRLDETGMLRLRFWSWVFGNLISGPMELFFEEWIDCWGVASMALYPVVAGQVTSGTPP